MEKKKKLGRPKLSEKEKKREKKRKVGRPKGRKTSKPYVINEEHVISYLAERDKHLANQPSRATISDIDREYLDNILKAFRAKIEPSVTTEPIKYRTNAFKYQPKELFDNIMAYFEISIRYKQPLTKTGIIAFNGVPKKYLYPEGYPFPPEYAFIGECLDFIEFYMEYTGQKKRNPAFQIFWLKNKGWVDKIELSTSVTEGALTDEERAMAQKRIAKFSE